MPIQTITLEEMAELQAMWARFQDTMRQILRELVRWLNQFLPALRRAGLLPPTKPHAHRKRRSRRRMLAYARQKARLKR